MASFFMVIIASVIGGTADIGREVQMQTRKAQFGESPLAGLMIDRITPWHATRSGSDDLQDKAFAQRRRHLIAAAVGTYGLALLSILLPVHDAWWPRGWDVSLASPMNDRDFGVGFLAGTAMAITTR